MEENFIEELKARLDLVEIVKRYAEVKKVGRNYMCKSPFRQERTPSFSISPEKQVWYDFGIGEGGDIISFIEKVERCSFTEAVEILAQMAGMDIPKKFYQKNEPKWEEKALIAKVHEEATNFFTKKLSQSPKAQKYARDRGLTPQTLQAWRIGYGGEDPQQNELTKYLLSKGFSHQILQRSGVSFEQSFGDRHWKDRFWGRLIFPIQELREGWIIAFSGRDILGREKVGKYINSPENPLYKKSSTLFGLYQAKPSIMEKDRVILVEGTIDVVLAHQAGFSETVATCGTALTLQHLRILKRFTQHIFLCFDSDNAGMQALLKAIKLCLPLDITPFVVQLPKVKDFGEFFLSSSAPTETLQAILKKAPPAFDFLLEHFLKTYNPSNPAEEKRLLAEFFSFLSLSPHPVEQDRYLEALAKKLHHPKSVLQAEFEKFQKQKTLTPKLPEKKHTQTYSREALLAGFLFAFEDLFLPKLQEPEKKKKLLSLLQEPLVKNILQKWLDHTPLTEEERQHLTQWMLWQQALYPEHLPEETLWKDLSDRLKLLKQEKEKAERLQKAKALRNQLPSQS